MSDGADPRSVPWPRPGVTDAALEHRVCRHAVNPCARRKRRQALRRNSPAAILARSDAMKELLRTNDPVRLSWLQALLADAGIGCVVFDTHASIIEGSIGAIQRRIMVDDGMHWQACRLLRDAGEPIDG